MSRLLKITRLSRTLDHLRHSWHVSLFGSVIMFGAMTHDLLSSVQRYPVVPFHGVPNICTRTPLDSSVKLLSGHYEPANFIATCTRIKACAPINGVHGVLHLSTTGFDRLHVFPFQADQSSEGVAILECSGPTPINHLFVRCITGTIADHYKSPSPATPISCSHRYCPKMLKGDFTILNFLAGAV